MTYKVIDIEGVGEVYAEKLIAAGIKTDAELLEKSLDLDDVGTGHYWLYRLWRCHQSWYPAGYLYQSDPVLGTYHR